MVGINKFFLWFITSIFGAFGCFAQQSLNEKATIYGRWKVVKIDYRGYQKFSIEQAKQIRHSILSVQNNTFFYNSIKFIEPCSFYGWNVKNYDTSENQMYNIGFIYSKKELDKLLILEPVDSIGNASCYNECAVFFLKQDTLINICGGYTFYLLKQTSLAKSKNFSGIGSNSKELSVLENSNSMELSYDFYQEADELIVKDQNGNLLFKTGTVTTHKKQTVKLSLKDVSKLVFTIKSEKANSKWRFNVTYK